MSFPFDIKTCDFLFVYHFLLPCLAHKTCSVLMLLYHLMIPDGLLVVTDNDNGWATCNLHTKCRNCKGEKEDEKVTARKEMFLFFGTA